jgi:hypothetical protein
VAVRAAGCVLVGGNVVNVPHPLGCAGSGRVTGGRYHAGCGVAHCWVLREQARPPHPEVGVGAVLCLSDGSMPVVKLSGSPVPGPCPALRGTRHGSGFRVGWPVWGVGFRGVFENWIADASI